LWSLRNRLQPVAERAEHTFNRRAQRGKPETT